MSTKVKSAIITGFLSQTKDRFHEYNKKIDLDEKFAMIASMPDTDGVEVVYPYEVPSAAELKELLTKYSLSVAAINVNVKAEPEFRNGGLTSTDAGVRAKAVKLIKEAKEYAAEVGADKVTCCPLGDGYEFNFQCDYGQMWRYLVETFGEAATHKPEMPLFIEYKPSETRGRCFVDTSSKALCLLNDIKAQNLGITLDFGHSTYGNENPAEAVSLLAESGKPYYIHINDNDGRWDWDYMVGTKHLLDYVEFLYYLKKFNYSDYLTSDTSPTRWDIQGVFEMNARVTNKIWALLDRIDLKRFEGLISGGDYLKTWRFIEEEIFSLK